MGGEVGSSTCRRPPPHPPTHTSAVPSAIAAQPALMATFALMHASVTVCAGSVYGRPALNTASRAMLDVRDS